MGQLVDQHHLRAAREDGVDVHLLEDSSFVFDSFPRNRLNISEEVFDALAAVSFHDSDHDVFATAPAADRLAQHAKGFADTRSVAEEKLENTARLVRGRGYFQPVFRLLWQWIIFSSGKRRRALEWRNAEIPRRPDSGVRDFRCHRRRHRISLPPRNSCKPDYRRTDASSRNSSSFGGLGDGGVRLHVRGGDAGIQL